MSSVLRTFVDITERPLRYHRGHRVVVFQYYQQERHILPVTYNIPEVNGVNYMPHKRIR